MATLEARLASLITALGADWKQIYEDMGTVGALETTATNLVDAVNELKDAVDSVEDGVSGVLVVDDLEDVPPGTPANTPVFLKA